MEKIQDNQDIDEMKIKEDKEVKEKKPTMRQKMMTMITTKTMRSKYDDIEVEVTNIHSEKTYKIDMIE